MYLLSYYYQWAYLYTPSVGIWTFSWPYLNNPRLTSVRLGKCTTQSQDLRSTDNREQFKRTLKGSLFECALCSGIWHALEMDLLTYLLT